MTSIIVPCDVIARLGPIVLAAPEKNDTPMRSLRLDDGIVVANNSLLLVAENIGGFTGIHHVALDEALVAQCQTEAKFHSKVTFTFTPVLSYTVCKTTFGYVHPNNMYVAPQKSDFDKWRDIARRAGEPLESSSEYGMFWEIEQLRLLAQSSPSGKVVFETHIDASVKPVIARDPHDDNWFAVSRPYDKVFTTASATMPGWLK